MQRMKFSIEKIKHRNKTIKKENYWDFRQKAIRETISNLRRRIKKGRGGGIFLSILTIKRNIKTAQISENSEEEQEEEFKY